MQINIFSITILSDNTFLNNVLANFIGSLCGGVLIIFILFLINEKLYTIKLTGVWDTLGYVEVSNLFKGYEYKWTIHILQKGNEILGYGEKISEKSPNGDFYAYEIQKRVIIDIKGSINKKYFANSEVNFVINEHGRLRESGTVYFLKYNRRKKKLVGSFSSTAADSSGTVIMIKK